MKKCECTIYGQYIDPEIYLKATGHSLRQKIIYNLFSKTIDGPITKKNLAILTGIDYNQLVYQLNNQLHTFWEIKRTEKVRGAHNEYIAPLDNNTIYVYMGQNAVIWNIDPLGNLFGKLKTTGTRCKHCSTSQIKSCLSEQECSCDCMLKNIDSKKQSNLLKTNCKEPYTPIDYLLTCTVIMSLEKQKCSMEFTTCNCHFLNNIRNK